MLDLLYFFSTTFDDILHFMFSENSLPPDFEAHISSPDGNCLYNSVSLALFGDERAAYRLRLAAVCDGIINSKLYIKEVISFSFQQLRY